MELWWYSARCGFNLFRNGCPNMDFSYFVENSYGKTNLHSAQRLKLNVTASVEFRYSDEFYIFGVAVSSEFVTV